MSSPARPLSETLRELREAADLSGSEASRRAGLAQARISRMETGRRAPDDSDSRALAPVYQVPPEVRRQLLSQARELRESRTPARTVLHRHGGHRVQDRIGRIEQAAARVRSFQPTIVIGLLQTPDDARALLSGAYAGEDLDAVVAARLRRQHILDTDREFHLVLTEGALRWHVGSPQIMAEQAEHITRAAQRPNVQLGIIPWTRPVTHPVLHGFQIYDDSAAMLGTETATAVHTDPPDVADYSKRFGIYAALADYGPAAQTALERLAAEYRSL